MCGFESHSGQSKEFGPVVQRQRRLAYTQETVVRLHPGSLAAERCSAAFNNMGLSFNGRMPALQASDPGSIPGGSTVRFEISNLRLGHIRKVAGYGWPDRTANAVLAMR